MHCDNQLYQEQVSGQLQEDIERGGQLSYYSDCIAMFNYNRVTDNLEDGISVIIGPVPQSG